MTQSQASKASSPGQDRPANRKANPGKPGDAKFWV